MIFIDYFTKAATNLYTTITTNPTSPAAQTAKLIGAGLGLTAIYLGVKRWPKTSLAFALGAAAIYRYWPTSPSGNSTTQEVQDFQTIPRGAAKPQMFSQPNQATHTPNNPGNLRSPPSTTNHNPSASYTPSSSTPSPYLTSAQHNSLPSVPEESKSNDSQHTVLKIGTYNILFPQIFEGNKPHKNSSPVGFSVGLPGKPNAGQLYENSIYRTTVIAKNILQADLDIVCLQEATKTVLNNLESQTNYKALQRLNGDKHGPAILYNPNKLDIFSENDVLIGKDPSILKNETNVRLNQRPISIADFQHKTTKKTIRVISCHLHDPRDKIGEAKKEQAQFIVNTANADLYKYKKIDECIIAGDFNQDEHGDIGNGKKPISNTPNARNATSLEPLFAAKFDVDDNLTPSEYTKKNFDNGPVIVKTRQDGKTRRIDWIFSKTKPKHLPLPNFDKNGSDHRLVAVTIPL